MLCPGGTQAVDAALLLAEMAVLHPARPAWPDVLRFVHTSVLPGSLARLIRQAAITAICDGTERITKTCSPRSGSTASPNKATAPTPARPRPRIKRP
ncbi:hypothetical protein [Streptomyces sp. NPDC001750]|uniref:hypothetical protein n=1 Tax=Streptomyces sp. NPDC001750 TaxID=3364607 RepID=UPI00367F3ADC